MYKKEVIIVGKKSFISQKLVNKLWKKKKIHIIEGKKNYYSKPDWFNLIKKDTTIVFFAFDNIGYNGPYTFETVRGSNPVNTALYNMGLVNFFKSNSQLNG